MCVCFLSFDMRFVEIEVVVGLVLCIDFPVHKYSGRCCYVLQFILSFVIFKAVSTIIKKKEQKQVRIEANFAFYSYLFLFFF